MSSHCPKLIVITEDRRPLLVSTRSSRRGEFVVIGFTAFDREKVIRHSLISKLVEEGGKEVKRPICYDDCPARSAGLRFLEDSVDWRIELEMSVNLKDWEHLEYLQASQGCSFDTHPVLVGKRSPAFSAVRQPLER